MIAFVAVLLFGVPSGCNVEGGVPSWERCTTYLGTPAFSVEDFGWGAALNIVVPVVATVLVGFGTCGGYWEGRIRTSAGFHRGACLRWSVVASAESSVEVATVSRLVKVVVLVVALTACDEAVVFQGSASSPDSLVIPSSTSAPTTVEPTPAPDTGAYDWAAVTISDLNLWRNGPVTHEILNTLTTTCLDSANAFTRMGQVLLGDVERVLSIGVAAENGTASIADASTAFDVWGNTALVVGYMAIHAVDNSSFPPAAVAFIDEFGEAARHAGGSAFGIGSQAFLTATGEINQSALEVWHGGLSEGLDELRATTGSVDSEVVCR